MTDIKKTAEALRKRGYEVACFETAKEAAVYLDSKINGVTVGLGDSETLLALRLYERLSRHNEVCDPQHPRDGRFYATARQCLTTEIFLTSVNGHCGNGRNGQHRWHREPHCRFPVWASQSVFCRRQE